MGFLYTLDSIPAKFPHCMITVLLCVILILTGIKEILRNGKKDTEIFLQFFSTFKDLPVSKLSDDDFCEVISL